MPASPLTGGTGVVEVDPISRIEGHLGVKLTVTSGFVTGANVHGNLWRGFENFLIGRQPNDAITFTQRICGVCPVPHGQTATFAVDAVHGFNQNFQTWVTAAEGGKWGGPTGEVTPAVATPTDEGVPYKAVLIRNLVLSAEFLMSHITHSYHLAAPSYIQGPNMPPWTPYFNENYYNTDYLLSNERALPEKTIAVGDTDGYSKDLWSAVITQYVKALRIRRLTFEAGALFAGRMPMTSCYVAGGVTNDNTANLQAKCTKYRDMMAEIGTFIIKEFVPTFLALGVLYPKYDNKFNNGKVAGDLDTGATWGFGAGVGNFLSWGGFPQKNGSLYLKRGFMMKDVATSGTPVRSTITSGAVLTNLKEHISYSRYENSIAGSETVEITNPAEQYRTVPVRNDENKYSWLKAPRWNNQPMEVGPFARMVVGKLYPANGSPLASWPDLTGVYMTYTKTRGAFTGLDPAMINPDLAVALVRDGLATVRIGAAGPVYGAGIAYGAYDITGASLATLNSVYGNTDAVIMGPVAAAVIGLKGGLSTMDRLRARALEAAFTIVNMIGMFTPGATGTTAMTWPAMSGWIGELYNATDLSYETYIARSTPNTMRFGFGATEAPRGALMHMCRIEAGRISQYQCIVPTTWNAAPKCANNLLGPMEKAMIGIPYSEDRSEFFSAADGTTVISAGSGVEALRIAQSFDPCIACAVH